ncbi:MAG: zinc-ribbon domain-containing protein, partial [Gaiellaceae bacterium]
MTTPTEAPDGPLCPSCGAANPASSRFCNSCGARLDALAPREERKLVSIL